MIDTLPEPPRKKRRVTPRDILLPYQAKWANDTARFKLGMMARQTGKDFSCGEEGVRDCKATEARGDKTNWLIAAPSERQSLESLDKWKDWARAYDYVVASYDEERVDSRRSESLLKSATITFPGGSRVIAVPGKPDTVRGFSANVELTEFAYFEQPDLTWRAILPSITNPLRGGVKKVRIISTPNGIGNKFHDLWVNNYGVTDATWSCHRVSIHDAVAQGLPVDVTELRNAIDDAEGWAQEYELEFMDAASVLLPYELITSCESADAMSTARPDFWTPIHAERELYMGIDFGRTKDLTVAWTLQAVGDVLQTVEVLELDGMATPEQIEILRPRIQRCRHVALDYTGPGVGFGDFLAKEFHEYDPVKHLFGKIELCTFTNPLKVEIFSKLRIAFEKARLRIPINRAIREDLHSVSRVSTATGQITYKAPHRVDGHADRCTSLALARKAAEQNSGVSAAQVFRSSFRSGFNPLIANSALRGKGCF